MGCIRAMRTARQAACVAAVPGRDATTDGSIASHVLPTRAPARRQSTIAGIWSDMRPEWSKCAMMVTDPRCGTMRASLIVMAIAFGGAAMAQPPMSEGRYRLPYADGTG